MAPRWRQVVYSDDPSPEDYEAAADEVSAIRSELASIRHRLRKLSQIETSHASDSDSTANDAEGALTLVIMGLYTLTDNHGGPMDRSFQRRAQRRRGLLDDVKNDPDAYIVETRKKD